MKTGIRTLPEDNGLILVENVVLYVAHFMMNCDEISLVNRGTLFDAEIFAITKVPSRRMAYNFTILRFFNDRRGSVAHHHWFQT